MCCPTGKHVVGDKDRAEKQILHISRLGDGATLKIA